jgi:hypothetical protein
MGSMKTSRFVVAVAVAVALAGPSAPALAQERLDKFQIDMWGGTWRPDCANAKGPEVTVLADALVYVNGNTRVVGTTNWATGSWFGNSPPADYVTTFVSAMPGDQQFLGMVFKDAKGEYMTLDGDANVVAKIGKANAALKYRRCPPAGAKASAPEPAAKTAAQVAADEAAAAAAAANPDAGGMIAQPKFKAAYLKALGKWSKEPWLKDLDGPTPPSRLVTVAGTEYRLVSSCKNHDCYNNNVVVLYSEAKGIAYGRIMVATKSAMIGNPPPAVATQLGELWRQEFRKNP